MIAAVAAMIIAAGSAETYGHDTTAHARAGAVVADDSGPAAAFTNPAALSRLQGAALHTSFQMALPQLTIDTERDFADDDPLRPAIPAPVSAFAIGFGMPVNLIVDDVLFVGFTAYVPQGALVRARAYDPARPSFYIYDASTEHYELFAATSIKLTSWLSLGVGARLGAGQGGVVNLDVDLVRGRFTEQSIDTSQFGVSSALAGLLVGPVGFDEVKFRGALVVRDRSSFDVVLPASLTIDGLDTSLLIDLVTLSNFSPRTWTLGVQLDVLDRFEFALDAQYAQWSEAPPPFLRVSNDISGDGLSRLGFGDVLDAPGPGQERVVSPGFVDTINLRVGVEAEVIDGVVVRGGYALRPTPVPDQTSATNIVDNTTHTIATGASVSSFLPAVADKPLTFDVAYQAVLLAPRVAQKASARDAIGGWTSSGVVHHVSLGLRYAW